MRIKNLTLQDVMYLNDIWGPSLDLYFKPGMKNLKNQAIKAKMVGRTVENLKSGLAAFRVENRVTICSEGEISLGEKAFDGSCFHSIHFQGIQTSHMKDMTRLFAESQIEEIDFRGFSTSEATDMSHMFFFCRTACLDLRSFRTSKVQKMQGMFKWCSLEKLDLTSFDTSHVRNMDDMLEGCSVKELLLG